MKLVIIESPFAGGLEGIHLAYARRALAHSLSLGEAPLASHLLYPQVLDDATPAERLQGIEAGFAWLARSTLQVFYSDYGWSEGMVLARERGEALGILQIIRYIGPGEAPGEAL
jgi:hypothetical protein